MSGGRDGNRREIKYEHVWLITSVFSRREPIPVPHRNEPVVRSRSPG